MLCCVYSAGVLVILLLAALLHALSYRFVFRLICLIDRRTVRAGIAAVADVQCVLQPLNATLLGYSKAYQVDLRNVVNTNIQAFSQLQATQPQG